MSKILEAAREAAQKRRDDNDAIRGIAYAPHYRKLEGLINALLSTAGGLPEDRQRHDDPSSPFFSAITLPSEDGLTFRLKDFNVLEVHAWNGPVGQWSWFTVRSLADIGELCLKEPTPNKENAA